MIIRPVLPKDIAEIASLDVSYSTDCVWQMEQKAVGEEVKTIFRPVRLPRPIKVGNTQDNSWLERWQKSDLLLAAEEKTMVVGYLHLEVDRVQNVGKIAHLAIDRKTRRIGFGAALVQVAKRWSKVRRVRCLTLETQTQNYPALSFFQKYAFSFCGFNDSCYANKDIAIFMVCPLG